LLGPLVIRAQNYSWEMPGLADLPIGASLPSGESHWQERNAPWQQRQPKPSPIGTLADLKGKRLATIKGSAGQDLALKPLEKAGLEPTDVQWIHLANGEAKSVLASGAIDA